MRIVFNELGVITSHNFSEQGDSLRQGSVGNVLVAKLTNAINTNLIATLNFTRPDGTAITDVLMDNQGTDEFKIKFSDPWYFALSGNATLTIFVRDSGGNIAVQGQVQVPIEPTDYDGNSVAPITNTQYTELLARIAGKMNRTGASEIGDALSFVDNENNTVFSWTKSNGGQFHVPMSFSSIEVATLTINGYAAATESYVQTELLPYATKSYVLEKINQIVLDPFELKADATSKYNELNGKISDVRAVAEGKTKSYTISTEDNESFNSQNASLSGVTSIKDISGNVIQVSSLKNGDVVLVVEIDVPDRWYSSADGKFYILETAKVDLSPYSTHVANGDIHVTAEDKSNWNGKSVVSGSGTGSSTTPISYITINGVEYAIVPAQLNAVWGQISGSIANQTDLKNALDAKQNALTFDNTPTQGSSNPVTSGGVYTICQTIEETAAGKCKSYVIDTQSQITGTKDSSDNYTNVTAITGVTLSDLKVGDQIFIKQLEVPDYWISALVYVGDVLSSVSLNKMETSKVNLTPYDTHINSSTVHVTAADKTNWNSKLAKSEVPNHQASTIVVRDAVTNVNGKALTSFHAENVTINGYEAIRIFTSGLESLTLEQASTYMKAQTGSEFVPTYNYDNPLNSYLLFTNGKMYKPQWDSSYGLVLYYMTTIGKTTLYKHSLSITGVSPTYYIISDSSTPITSVSSLSLAINAYGALSLWNSNFTPILTIAYNGYASKYQAIYAYINSSNGNLSLERQDLGAGDTAITDTVTTL